ncbi:MAG TPA: adenylate/guanylate cyclase domain-containing protein, partial [Leptolyngbyaceae cyanobacterium M65_K2018_010]|nr:adenylate/guanylate cyclase domain-containing protein [Leptolyngbyaceae cyanobacterium M65_K2018_010]
LFADIVNFTPLAAQTSPLELVDWLNKIFSEFDRLADRYRLEKIKTIGDAYMVVGGLPLPMGDHAQAVMEMALAMQAAADRITRSDGQSFQLRIGINTGAVVAGVIGIKKFSYDLWGDAVNIASRMESQGTPGKIQVTEATYQRIKDLYEFEPVGQVLVKGRGYLTSYQYVKRKPER